MLHVALIFLCIAQILHFSRHWLVLTARLREEARDQRLKEHLDWKTLHRNPALGSAAPGSAVRRA